MSKVCLAILYKNYNCSLIDKFEILYKNNFDYILHIMPLYDGGRENVAAVFENKYQMCGYIPQALCRLPFDDFTHYIFMTQDCILNPEINSFNYKDKFKIDDDSAFIADDIFPVSIDTMHSTDWAFVSVYNYTYRKNGAEIREFIPLKVDARAIYSKFGVKAPYIYTDYFSYLVENLIHGRIHTHSFKLNLEYGNMNIKTLTDGFSSKVEKEKLVTIYPFVASDSNFFILPKAAIPKFAHYCGLFASARMHHNIGFANSLVFSCEKIVMKKDILQENLIDIIKDESALWSQFSHNLNSFLSDSKHLLAHPIMLDKWDVKEV